MAREEELALRVEADTDQARRDLHALEEVAEGIEDVEITPEIDTSAIDRFISDLKEVTDEVERTARAADEIGKFAPSVDISELTQMVNELRQAGAEFDAIEAKAKELGAAVESIGTADPMKNLGTSARAARGDMDSLRSSSDQSRSVLANLAGNAAQDLGELGGVVGSLGVGVGQLAEYAVDGNIALSQLAAVAGPMAALTGALALVNKYLGEADAEFAAQRARIDAFTESIEDAGTGGQAAAEGLQALSDAVEPSAPGMLDRLGAAAANLGEDLVNLLTLQEGMGGYTVNDLIGDLSAMGVTMNDLAPILAGTEDDLDAFLAKLREDPASDGRYDRIAEEVRNLWDAYREGEGAATATDAFFASTATSAEAALQRLDEAAATTQERWDFLIASMQKGALTENAAAVWNALREELGLTEEAMAELADQRLAEQLEEDAQAADELRQSAQEMAQALADAGDEIAGIRSSLPDLGAELAASLDVSDTTLDFQTIKADLLDAIGELGDYIAQNPVDWGPVFDPSQGWEGLDSEFLGRVTAVRDQLQAGIASTFETGGSSAAQQFANAFVDQVSQETGLTTAQVYELVGLDSTGSVEAEIMPIVNAAAADRARSILDAITGAGIQDVRVAEIQIALARGDISGEVAEIASLLVAQTLGIPVELGDIPPDDLAAAQTYLDANPVTVPVEGDTKPAKGEVDKLRTDAARTPATVEVEGDTDPAAGAIAGIEEGDYSATINAGLTQQLIQGMILSAFLDHVARARTTTITPLLTGAAAAALGLNVLTVDRTVNLRVEIDNLWEVERQLQQLTRDRTATITTRLGGGRIGAAAS